MNNYRAAHLVQVLRARAEQAPDAVTYEMLDRKGHLTTLSNAQLASRASVLAGRLVGRGNGPVMLMYPAGLEYVVGVFAAFLAGMPVVPAYPRTGSTVADRERLDGIADDAKPSVVIATDPHPTLPTVTVPGPEADGEPLQQPNAASELAIVQYTSGSTGRPRGVLVRHDSLAANTAAIAQCFGLSPTSRGLTWLPPHHDMGLIGGILTPLTVGAATRVMQPVDFIKAPLSWLTQLSQSGATVSGGPNFAYDLCVRRARRDDALTGLDLSGWRVAFNGAETVKQRTMTEFAECFAPAGFDPAAFLPCYGLAEATLIVSAGHWSGSAGGTAVSCGPPVAGQRVAVVDPESATACAEGQEGEIWVAGEHVTNGYWSSDTGELFGELAGERYLRTGDLGCLRAGELVPTGRLKDVIAYRGVKHHAVDVESAALDAMGGIGGTAAAFLVDTEQEAFPVLVLGVRGAPDGRLVTAVRAAVLEHTGLRLSIIALVPPGAVPRTSSGKIRRSVCRDAFLSGAYDEAVVDDDRDRHATLVGERTRAAVVIELTQMICGIVAGVSDLLDCHPDDRLLELGVDSIRGAEAAAILQDALDLDVPLTEVLTASTPQLMSDALVQHWLAEGVPAGRIRDRITAVVTDRAVA